MDIKIGYPDYFSNATYLNILYNGYSFSKKNYIENYFTAVRAEVAKSFSELRKPFDTKE
jgi:predicted metalloendopeptidase